jgi:protein tyrosine phosphatase
LKCEQYWPDAENEEKMYGDIGVTLTSIVRTVDFVVRSFELRKDGAAVRHVKQFHYTGWPDHGVPTRSSPIIAFRRRIRAHDKSHPGIIVVHCSAGVGRTGAFIAIDYLLEQAEHERVIDLFGLTCQMRRNRANMIQTVEQYIFVYDALLEALKVGKTVISCSVFKEEFEHLCVVDPVRNKSPLEEQYELLDKMSPKSKPEDYNLGSQPENQEKNRCPNILPADRHRPYLMTRVQGTNDYINAVFLDGYRSSNAYIIT